MTMARQWHSVQDTYGHLLQLIPSDRFLKMQSLKEVPFFICPYPPQEQVAVDRMVGQLTNKLEQTGVQILEINLYDLSIDLLKKRNVWTRILETESAISKDQLHELLNGILDVEDHLIPAIASRMADTKCDVMFMTGIGEVYPYIRSHNVLSNLQKTAKDHPMLMFFPGKYTHSLERGASLDLFGRLNDDGYYRAFNIFDIET